MAPSDIVQALSMANEVDRNRHVCPDGGTCGLRMRWLAVGNLDLSIRCLIKRNRCGSSLALTKRLESQDLTLYLLQRTGQRLVGHRRLSTIFDTLPPVAAWAQIPH
jgi:hypothetical protein